MGSSAESESEESVNVRAECEIPREERPGRGEIFGDVARSSSEDLSSIPDSGSDLASQERRAASKYKALLLR